MKRRPRIYYSDSKKALMWGRWKQGWTLQEIGKLFAIHRILAETGFIRPRRAIPFPDCVDADIAEANERIFLVLGHDEAMKR